VLPIRATSAEQRRRNAKKSISRAANMSDKGIFVYAWDLVDEGFAAVGARLRDAGADTVAMATSYHAGKFIRPHGHSGKVYFPDDGTIYFRHRPERYGRVQPIPHPMLEHVDPLVELAREAPDMALVGWTVCCHNTRLGQAHPELIARNAMGDGLIYSLNPAHPDVRHYIVTLAADLADRYELAALTLETPGWLPYAHGYHHEFALLPLDPWIDFYLGLCFAPATVTAARAAGIDADGLRHRVAARIEAWLGSDVAVGERAAEWVQADLVGDGELRAFLDWRCRCVADLVAEMRAALPAATALRVIPSVQRPTARCWIEGSDLAMLGAVADHLDVCFYEPSAAAVAADLFDVTQRLGGTAKLGAILRPTHPDLAGGGETAVAATTLKRAGLQGLSFYNYGHWRLGALDHVKAAFAVWDGQGEAL
ncbi:MAG: hypothetical protein JRE18_08290, partial [Deltaproteobacteria bacterium]|jgi:hypothetical protein|nr:hypothetical protein [Deltaproteobacteria bacterium]